MIPHTSSQIASISAGFMLFSWGTEGDRRDGRSAQNPAHIMRGQSLGARTGGVAFAGTYSTEGNGLMANNERAAQMAVEWWADRLMAGDVEKFKETLKPLVLGDLERNGECRLECDYDPRDHLLAAVRAAGIECAGFLFSACGILPQKHVLDVYPDRLVPKGGYGNWTAEIPVPG